MASKKQPKIITAEERYIKAIGEEKVKNSIPYSFIFPSWAKQCDFHFSLIGNCDYCLYDHIDNTVIVLFQNEENANFAKEKCEAIGGTWKKVNLKLITNLENVI